MLHVRDLRYFIAVTEHGHITRAAASLFVTQPAVSKQIAALERSLGAELFIRHSSGVDLTAAGRALVPFARRMVELNDEAVSEVRRIARSSQKLTIGFWLAPGGGFVSDAMSAFSSVHPEIRLGIRRADWGEPGAGVTEHKADVALVDTPHNQSIRGLHSYRLAVEDIVVAVADDHRLAGREWVDIDELSSETIFVVPPSHGQQWQKPFRVAHVEHVTTIDETIEGVILGLGVGLLTTSIAAHYPNPRICTMALRGAKPSDYRVTWRKEDEDRPEITDLVRCLVEAYRAGSTAPTRQQPSRGG